MTTMNGVVIDATTKEIIKILPWLPWLPWWLVKEAIKRKKKKDKDKECYNRLFGFLSNSEISVDKIYTAIDGVPQVHPQDKETLRSLRGLIHELSEKERKEELVLGVIPLDKNQNICSIGGPVSHSLTREAMGYDKNGKIKTTTLPYVFNIQKEEVGFPDIRVKVIAEGKTWYEPNWLIIDSSTRKVTNYVPEVADDGNLKRDYLMLIVIPNKLTKKAFKMGKKHMIITGCHGLGTSAISQILENSELVCELDRKATTGFFQSIIEIPRIEWDFYEKRYLFKEEPIIREVIDLGEKI